MADIELVIKISEDSYKATCNGWTLPQDVENIVQGIKNGTPLQSHGRLIDADALKEKMLNTEIKIGDDKTLWGRAVSVALDRYAPTVIEADRSEEE